MKNTIVIPEGPWTLRRPKLRNGSPLEFACPKCKKKCVCTDYGSTLVGYYSPPGHDHDDNCKTYYFMCECGNHFKISPINLCSNTDCYWEGQHDCGVCGT